MKWCLGVSFVIGVALTVNSLCHGACQSAPECAFDGGVFASIASMVAYCFFRDNEFTAAKAIYSAFLSAMSVWIPFLTLSVLFCLKKGGV